MFSQSQKQKIAEEIEKLLLSFDHPEMPEEKPFFNIRIEGKENWSWEEILPNWTHDEKRVRIKIRIGKARKK